MKSVSGNYEHSTAWVPGKMLAGFEGFSPNGNPQLALMSFSASEPSLKGKCSEMLCSGRGFEFTNGWISLWETRLIVKCLWS